MHRKLRIKIILIFQMVSILGNRLAILLSLLTESWQQPLPGCLLIPEGEARLAWKSGGIPLRPPIGCTPGNVDR